MAHLSIMNHPFPCRIVQLPLCVLMTAVPQLHRLHTNVMPGCVLYLYLCGALWTLACPQAVTLRAARLRGEARPA
jgi:hypothetical protein